MHVFVSVLSKTYIIASGMQWLGM